MVGPDNVEASRAEDQGTEQERPVQEAVYRVKVLHSSATEACRACEGRRLSPGDLVVVPTRYGKELGQVQGCLCGYEGEEVRAVERAASEEDVERYEAHRRKEEQAFRLCREKIRERGLEMKLVAAHYLLEEPKILFYFTAEARVDFRELVKDLVSVFHTRIELRQIGVRDEARVLGGMGVCGRTFCCHGITDKLRPVSIKMAKEQNLTLNSMKISGPCGRLLCCLAYEFETYQELRRGVPGEGTRLQVQSRSMKVIDVNIFTSTVRLAGEGGHTLELDFAAFSYDRAAGRWQVRSE